MQMNESSRRLDWDWPSYTWPKRYRKKNTSMKVNTYFVFFLNLAPQFDILPTRIWKYFIVQKSFLETILPLYLKASEMKKLLDSCNFLILGSSCSLPNSYHRQLSFLSSIRSNLNAKYYDYSVYMRCWQPFKEFLKTFVSCREFASSPRTKFLKKYILGLTKVCINVMLA